ncbi:MAG: heme-binding protein [Betaproteobacteria bacterium]
MPHALIQRLSLSLLALFSGLAMAVEQARYEVISAQGDFELRHYPPLLIAQTVVEGNMDQASRKGFQLLADFIFGNNLAAGGAGPGKIEMTAPVTVEPQSAKIAMTAPVTVQAEGARSEAGQWRVHFVMPSQYTLASIPKPRNPAVELRELPSQWFVAHKFSGFTTESRVDAKTQEAVQWARQQALTALSPPQLARYDPPWTLPMFRRNEILIEVSAPASAKP